MAHPHSSVARAVFGVGLALGLGGCPAESPSDQHERVASAVGDVVARKPWLQPTDPVDPDVWLASRAAGRDVAPSDPDVAIWRALLADADQRFGETDRMLANRAVQLEAMLREIGGSETPREILPDLSSLAAKGSRSGFSDLCQHYYNLRSQGQTREVALANLKREGNGRSAGAPENRAAGSAP